MSTVKPSKTIATSVYQKVRADILNGELKPGLKLAIDEVAARYGVGTNPVREALTRLSAERLVDRHEQRGFFVPEIDVAGWKELVKTRCLLETNALESAMLNRTSAWEEGIVLSFYRLERKNLDSSIDTRKVWETNHRDFHMALIANCTSFWLLEFCEILMDQAQRYISISNSTQYPRRNGIEEHRKLMDSVLSGEGDVAKELLILHYNHTMRDIEGEMATV